MQAQCNDGSSPVNFSEFFGDFSDLFLKDLKKWNTSLTEKTDEVLEQNLKSADKFRKSAIVDMSKILCVLRSRMSDYRFDKLLERNGISKIAGRRFAEAGAEALQGGKA